MTEQVTFAGLEDLEAMDDDVTVCAVIKPGQPKPMPVKDQDAAAYQALLAAWEKAHVRRYRLGHLGNAEYNDIVASVPGPVPPTQVVMGKREADKEDPGYKMKLWAVEERRRLLLLARSLEKGGMTIPGDALADKANWLSRRPTNIIGALETAFAQAHHNLNWRLESQAAAFQPVPGAGDADTSGVEAEQS